MKKVSRWLGNLVLGISFLGLLAVLIALTFFNVDFATVMSGSMVPRLEVGGVIAYQKIDFSEVKADDIIVFRSPDEELPITHRVIEIVRTENRINFRTKGDALEEADLRLVGEKDFLGKVIFHLPWFGYYSQFISTRKGFLLGMGLPAVLLTILILREAGSELKKVKERGEKR